VATSDPSFSLGLVVCLSRNLPFKHGDSEDLSLRSHSRSEPSPQSVGTVPSEDSAATDQPDDDFLTDAEMRDQEKSNILNVLRLTSWRVSGDGGAAELLGLKPSTLAYRMRTLGIEKTRL
jgi:transcriptional regulator with GAF, ATPase, and Fis domain